jgi:hypothetical protein
VVVSIAGLISAEAKVALWLGLKMIPFQKQFRIWYLTSFQLQMPIKNLEYSDKWNDYFFLQV